MKFGEVLIEKGLRVAHYSHKLKDYFDIIKKNVYNNHAVVRTEEM